MTNLVAGNFSLWHLIEEIINWDYLADWLIKLYPYIHAIKYVIDMACV